MTDPKFTPGPWAYSDDLQSGIATVGRVAQFVIGPDYGSPEMADYSDHGADEADARLISAAPELLEALEWLVALMPDPEQDTDAVQRQYGIKARAAIAKATGAAQ